MVPSTLIETVVKPAFRAAEIPFFTDENDPSEITTMPTLAAAIDRPGGIPHSFMVRIYAYDDADQIVVGTTVASFRPEQRSEVAELVGAKLNARPTIQWWIGSSCQALYADHTITVSDMRDPQGAVIEAFFGLMKEIAAQFPAIVAITHPDPKARKPKRQTKASSRLESEIAEILDKTDS